MSVDQQGIAASSEATRSGEVSADRESKFAKAVTSARMTAANRLNAKKCTGPRTPRGKSHASVNALKHGVFARRRLIAGEDAKAYRDLSERVFAETGPSTAVEVMLAEQIVGDIWRLRRVEQAERAYLEHVRASNLAHATRTLPPIERAQMQKELEHQPVSVSSEQISRSVRCKLNAASRAEKAMLDAMVAPERVFPYSSLEQIRRSLIRGVLQKGSSLSELQAQYLTIETRASPKAPKEIPLSVQI